MSWRITGVEQLDVDALEAGIPRRRADVHWDDHYGHLVMEPGSEWVAAKLRQLDGTITSLGGSVTPLFTVDLKDRASTYWATMSLLWDFETSGELPDPVWRDTTPEGAVN